MFSVLEDVIHIQAYGDIENAQFNGASEYGIVSLTSISDQLAANPNATEVVVHIHSRGGDVDEGFAIHDLLVNSGKKVTTITEGLCASIATVIMLAGSTRKMTANSSFFIHNPWTLAIGNADQLERTADDTRAEEDKILDFYINKTGADRKEVSDMMKEETKMKPEKALSLGFVTEVVAEAKAKVYAKRANINHENMNYKSVMNAINELKEKIGIKNTTAEEIKALDLKIKNDELPLHIQTEADQPSIGDSVTYNGVASPDKVFEMEDGTKIKTDQDSRIVEILEKEVLQNSTEKSEEVTALEAKLAEQATELETVKAQNAKLIKDAEETSKQFKDLNEKVVALSKSIKSGHQPEGEPTRFRKNETETEEVPSAKRILDSMKKGRKTQPA